MGLLKKKCDQMEEVVIQLSRIIKEVLVLEIGVKYESANPRLIYQIDWKYEFGNG